jgi:hypothetical protein
MPNYDDSLRGYSFDTHRRDGFRCRYCGLDGTLSFANWLALSRDLLLPKGHPNRDDPDFIVTACKFCNMADNLYFSHAQRRGIRFDGLAPNQLIAQRLPYVEATGRNYQDFYKANVEVRRDVGEPA